MTRLLLMSVFVSLAAWPQARSIEPKRAPVEMESYLQGKNFYVLTAMEDGPLRPLFHANSGLQTLAESKAKALKEAAGSCPLELNCYAQKLRWTEEQIAAAGQQLAQLPAKNLAVQKLIRRLRESGMYQEYAAKPDPEFLTAAWTESAQSVNRVIDVYGLGKPPRYAEIDSLSYDVKDAVYPRLVHIILNVLEDDKAPPDLFFHPPLRFALQLLAANRRDEAARHEPLHRTENAAAIQRMKTVVWKQFPYSAIIVPGSGSTSTSIPISAFGQLRLTLAARRWQEAKAPFLIVSGGYVHPNQTPWNEALEMKKALIAEHGIPANAILIDPHARHTTTNLRNSARQIFRYGMPFDKAALIVTDEYQSSYIDGEVFRKRCMEELGYLPYRSFTRKSKIELEMVPAIESLAIDMNDTLDP